MCIYNPFVGICVLSVSIDVIWLYIVVLYEILCRLNITVSISKLNLVEGIDVVTSLLIKQSA